GKTTYLMALNAPDDAVVTTLTLGPDQVETYSQEATDSEKSVKDAITESVFSEFLYTNTPVEHKVRQLFMDSKKLDESQYAGTMVLIFVNGSHAYPHGVGDAQKASGMRAPGVLLLWHLYGGRHRAVDVYKALSPLAKELPLRYSQGTSLWA